MKKLIRFTLLAIPVVVLAAISAVWIEHKAPLTLPEPVGPYPVGRVICHWVDSSRVDSLAPEPGTKRELMVWIWYPAQPISSAKTAPYLSQPLQQAIRHQQGAIMAGLISHDPSSIETHSVEGAPLSSKCKKYPVILLKSGIGAFAADYTTLAEDLASDGYVVVASDAPYSTFVVVFPDGRVVLRNAQGRPGDSSPLPVFDRLVRFWSQDAGFTLDRLLQGKDLAGQFNGRLDTGHIGIMGHSFGGSTAAQFCHDDPRCKAGIDMDGQPFGSVVKEGIKKPFLFLMGDHSNEPDSITSVIRSKIMAIHQSSSSDHYLMTIKGAYHFNFSDMALTRERVIARAAHAIGPVGSRRGLHLTAECVRTFFDIYLRGASPGRLDSLPIRFPGLFLSTAADKTSFSSPVNSRY